MAGRISEALGGWLRKNILYYGEDIEAQEVVSGSGKGVTIGKGRK